jgi:hypothetical protein
MKEMRITAHEPEKLLGLEGLIEDVAILDNLA